MAGPGPKEERTERPTQTNTGSARPATPSSSGHRRALREQGTLAAQQSIVDPDRQPGFEEQDKARRAIKAGPDSRDSQSLQDDECLEVRNERNESNACEPGAAHIDTENLRADAARALMALVLRSGELSDRLRTRQSTAWGTLFEKAGRSPYVALNQAEYSGMVRTTTPLPESGPLGKVVGAMGNTTLDKALSHGGQAAMERAMAKAGGGGIAALGTLLSAFKGAGVPGFVFSTIVNIVWDVISGLLSPAPDVGEVVDAAIRSSQMARSAIDEMLRGACEAEKRSTLGALQQTHEFILKSQDRSAILKALEWANANLAALTTMPEAYDDKLVKNLLTCWVRQHSATPSKANKDTTQSTHDALKGTSKARLANRSNLFVDQCKYAWGPMGIALPRVTQHLESLLRGQPGKSPHELAEAMSGHSVLLAPVQDGKAFARYLQTEHPLDGAFGAAHPIAENPERAAANQTFALTCVLRLKEVEGSVCVDELEFNLQPRSGFDARQVDAVSYLNPDAPGNSAIARRSWTYSPHG